VGRLRLGLGLEPHVVNRLGSGPRVGGITSGGIFGRGLSPASGGVISRRLSPRIVIMTPSHRLQSADDNPLLRTRRRPCSAITDRDVLDIFYVDSIFSNDFLHGCTVSWAVLPLRCRQRRHQMELKTHSVKPSLDGSVTTAVRARPNGSVLLSDYWRRPPGTLVTRLFDFQLSGAAKT